MGRFFLPRETSLVNNLEKLGNWLDLGISLTSILQISDFNPLSFLLSSIFSLMARKGA